MEGAPRGGGQGRSTQKGGHGRSTRRRGIREGARGGGFHTILGYWTRSSHRKRDGQTRCHTWPLRQAERWLHWVARYRHQLARQAWCWCRLPCWLRQQTLCCAETRFFPSLHLEDLLKVGLSGTCASRDCRGWLDRL